MSDDGRDWEDIKPHLVRDMDGWHIEGAPYYAEIKDNGTRLFCPDRSERSKYFKLPAPPLFSGLSKQIVSTVVDKQLLPNKIVMPYMDWADIIIGFTNTGMTFSVLFKKAPPREFKEQFKFDAEVNGLDIKTLLASKVGIGVPRPRLIDSSSLVDVGSNEKYLDWTEKLSELTLDFSLEKLKFPVLLQNSTIDVEVDASANDGYWRTGTSTFSDTDTALFVGVLTSAINSFSRWAGITLPQTSTINTATLGLYEYDTAGAANSLVYSNDVADPVVPAGATAALKCADADAKTKSTASIAINNNPAGNQYFYYDVKTIIEEMTASRAYSNQAMMFLHLDNGAASWMRSRSYDYAGNSSGPELDVDYDAPAGGLSIPIVMHHRKQVATS